MAKRENTIDAALLEHSIREDLNKRALRTLAVLNPLKIVIDNYSDNLTEEMEAVNNPEDASAGTRLIPFSKEIFIERDDFRENPPKKFFRLSPGNEVRLRYAYIIKCVSVIKDDNGEIIELHCVYDPETKSGSINSGRKVKGTIHWVSAKYAVTAEVRLYDRLFNIENPSDDSNGKDWRSHINPDSLEILSDALVELGLKDAKAGTRYQFERQGYFCVDADSEAGKPVFNRTATLRDSWAKIEKNQ